MPEAGSRAEVRARRQEKEITQEIPDIKNILVPLDFSRVSRKALEYAVALAAKFDAKITLLHAMEPLPYDSGMLAASVDEDVSIRAMKKELDELAGVVVEPGFLNTVLVKPGLAFEVIANTARDLRIDLIVLTTHGRTCLKHVFMGSTAERVVRYAPCPVLVVRRCEHGFA